MKDKELKEYLQQALKQEEQPKRMEETITLCIGMLRKQKAGEKEVRTGFFSYLSDVFRFEGMGIWGLQAMTLFFVCLTISAIGDVPKYIPVFMPLFVLAMMPVFFKSQFYGMNEVEAATRASGAEIILAKLILAGAANLVCMTLLLCFEISLQHSCKEIGQMVLYCLVPYLVCMTVMLRLLRLCRKETIVVHGAVMCSLCIGFGISAKIWPWLYETSAAGIWIMAFFVFAIFFGKEIYFVIETRKEGNLYGIIA
ncbi:MAG: hypothetical protein NC412_08890 [Roseburia sp.]|nr:hypothetical protein [Roseburia sp.]MCM1277350.1 hypothetical protein [Robinsoniella sp.]